MARAAKEGRLILVDVYANLGIAQLLSRSFQEGIAQLGASRTGFPDHPQATRAARLTDVGRFSQGDAKARAGDAAGARKIYERLVDRSNAPSSFGPLAIGSPRWRPPARRRPLGKQSVRSDR